MSTEHGLLKSWNASKRQSAERKALRQSTEKKVAFW